MTANAIDLIMSMKLYRYLGCDKSLKSMRNFRASFSHAVEE